MPQGKPLEPKQKEKICNLRAQNETYKNIAKKVGVNFSTIWRVLKEEKEQQTNPSTNSKSTGADQSPADHTPETENSQPKEEKSMADEEKTRQVLSDVLDEREQRQESHKKFQELESLKNTVDQLQDTVKNLKNITPDYIQEQAGEALQNQRQSIENSAAEKARNQTLKALDEGVFQCLTREAFQQLTPQQKEEYCSQYGDSCPHLCSMIRNAPEPEPPKKSVEQMVAERYLSNPPAYPGDEIAIIRGLNANNGIYTGNPTMDGELKDVLRARGKVRSKPQEEPTEPEAPPEEETKPEESEEPEAPQEPEKPRVSEEEPEKPEEESDTVGIDFLGEDF